MTGRIGFVFIVFGVLLLIAGALELANDDLLDIGGVGLVVFGAVAMCIATDGDPERPS